MLCSALSHTQPKPQWRGEQASYPSNYVLCTPYSLGRDLPLLCSHPFSPAPTPVLWRISKAAVALWGRISKDLPWLRNNRMPQQRVRAAGNLDTTPQITPLVRRTVEVGGAGGMRLGSYDSWRRGRPCGVDVCFGG